MAAWLKNVKGGFALSLTQIWIHRQGAKAAKGRGVKSLKV